MSDRMRLTEDDRKMADGAYGEATRFAMSIVIRMATAVGAESLLRIEQAHIDACALMSRSSLDVVNHLADHGGRVAVPTTLSMVSLDLEHWQRLGVDPEFADMATQIADAYLRLGCVPAWTCAPYQGYLTPRFGQQIAWGESNAVAYANSVIGARTNRYPDYLDICAAITGRVPYTGLHQVENRRATFHVRLASTQAEEWQASAAWAALGYLVGKIVGERVPAIDGLQLSCPSNDGLKALGAAAASSGSVGLFHLVGVTPEAPELEVACHRRKPELTASITRRQLRDAWEELSTTDDETMVDAVILGCPHFSYAEFETLSRTISGYDNTRVHENVQFLLFAAAPMLELARRGGLLGPLEQFGVTIVRDTCPFHSPVVAPGAKTIMTNSGKCAYYAPGELDVQVAFGPLDACIDAARTGRMHEKRSPW